VQARLIAASALHRLQDKIARDEQLALAQAIQGSGSTSEGILLLSAQWAMEDRDAGRCMALLSELPPGVARRTQACG
jgi:HemY protein